MKKVISITIIIIVLIILHTVLSYNRFVKLSENINNAYSQVENVIQRRADLIPNLVSTVKGYAKHEKEIFEHLADARSKLMSAENAEKKAEALGELNDVLGKLLVIVENYPSLKADAHFLRLMDELSGTENRIAVERKRYNDKVREYNSMIRSFPLSITAKMFSFEKREYFEIRDDMERENVKVDLK